MFPVLGHFLLCEAAAMELCTTKDKLVYMANQQKHNFGAGPCILPISVTEKAAQAVGNWNGMGLSILEVSHRSREFEEVMRKTDLLVRELLGVPDQYEVLFLQGGASKQFEMVAQNLLQGSGKTKAAYLDSGYFAQKAIAQARLFGQVQIVASSREKAYNYIPASYSVDDDAAYLHVTSNNTIEGTQMSAFRNFGVPLVCDMSSDIFSRRIAVGDFDLIYAGAQKNLGPAGMTLVIIKKDLIGQIIHPLPAMGDYRAMAASGSLYNTPPVFAIYVAMLNLLWLKDQGGVAGIEKLNNQKAEMLYAAIDESELFYGAVQQGHRSKMNVVFRCHDPVLEKAFLVYVEERGIVGLKGHSSAGGFRASLYNALPLHSVEYLCGLIGSFQASVKLKAMSRADDPQSALS